MTSYILNLPYEILRAILSLLPVYDRVYDGRAQKAQILILRQVCRQFRLVCDELDCWRDPIFDFLMLLHWIEDDRARSDSELRFFASLLRDQHFASCLARKTDWQFSSLTTVLSILRYVPVFRDRALRVALMCECQTHVFMALVSLGICPNVTELSVDFGRDDEPVELDLFEITIAYPSLKTLKLFNVDTAVGSLGHSNIECLVILLGEYSDIGINLPISPLIPYKSSQTLTSLTLIGVEEFDIPVQLDRFVNLTYLEIAPLDDENLWSALMQDLGFRLDTFVVAVCAFDTIEEELVKIFSAPCFEVLRVLNFKIWPNGLLPGHPKPTEMIIETITQHLLLLQHLSLDIEMEISWCWSFARLSRLKELECRLLPNGMLGPIHPMDKLRIKLLEEFQKVFSSFEPAPRVDVSFVDILEKDGYLDRWLL